MSFQDKGIEKKTPIAPSMKIEMNQKIKNIEIDNTAKVDSAVIFPEKTV